jgi:CheY-like chemotaxis protein
MNELNTPQSYDVFTQWLRNALDNLYDTRAIQKNPLIEGFALGNMTRLQKSQNLRKILLQCIQSISGSQLPNSSPDWLAYRILEMRYLDSLSVDEVVSELSISKSQFFRDQARAINLLTDIVWDRYQTVKQTVGDQPVGQEHNLAWVEADRLSSQSGREIVDLDQLVEELESTIKMLGQEGGLTCILKLEGNVLLPSSDRVMLRQAILISCGFAVSWFPSGTLNIETFRKDKLMGLTLVIQGEPLDLPAPNDNSVNIAQELLSRQGGVLTFSQQPGMGRITLEWSTSKPTVLVVDDDSDIVALFRRYLVGFPWNVIGAANGVEARKQIETIRPAVIMLDVMMPQEDGWELLAALKRVPETKDIPVIVCSVLMSPKLATNLGAAACLPKPVSQHALIEALSHWSLTTLPEALSS